MKKKKLFLILVYAFFFLASMTTHVFAATTTEGGCTRVGQCVDNKRCILKDVPGAPAGTQVITPAGGDCGSSSLGPVTLPAGIAKFNGKTGGQIGILVFITSLVRVFIIVCGLWTLFNFLYSGYLLVSAQSDTKVYQEVKDKITMTMVGLGIIAGAYMLAALIGLIFFGDAGFILNPTLQGALSK